MQTRGGFIMALPTRVQRGQLTDPLETAQREFDGMLNRWFGGRETNGGTGGYLAPYAVDVREDADHLYVEAELPGFKKVEIDVTLENKTPTISAKRKSDQKKEDPKGELLLHERRYS